MSTKGYLCLVLLIVLMLTACTEGSSNLSPSEEDTRVINDAFGETEVPAHPKRIVTTYDDDADHLLALGIKPVGVPTVTNRDNIDGYHPYLAEKLKGVAQVGDEAWDGANYEAILALEPDLILAGEWAEQAGDELKKIAPVAFYQWEGDWRKRHLEIGRLVNKQEEAKKNVDEFNKRAEEVRSRLEKEGKTELKAAFIKIVSDKRIILYAEEPGDIGLMLYDWLGFQVPNGVPKDDWQRDITLEGLTAVDADILFVQVFGGNEGQNAYKKISDSKVWKGLRAVREHQVYVLPEYPWSRGSGPIGFQEGLEQIVTSLLE
jgi:iron complex transport system substrate-binding protein